MTIQELKTRLLHIEDAYHSFVVGIMVYAEKKQSRVDAIAHFLDEHPDALTSDVVGFVSDQPDFYEDAAPVKVG